MAQGNTKLCEVTRGTFFLSPPPVKCYRLPKSFSLKKTEWATMAKESQFVHILSSDKVHFKCYQIKLMGLYRDTVVQIAMFVRVRLVS